MNNTSDDQVIQQVTAALNAQADAAFPDDRLKRQHARILQRLEHEGRPGRVIAFPASRAAMPVSLLQTSPTTRWVAAAALIAFVAGVAAGQRFPTGFPVQTESQIATSRPGPAPEVAPTSLRASAPLALSDDEFLGELEIAAQSRPAVLRHMDAVTPRAWDVEVGQ